jgi:acetoin utilization deacetylase AcuC-like enzyme
MVTAYYHPGYAAPLGQHVMPIRKFGLVAEAVSAKGLAALAEPAPLTEVDLLRAHTRAYVDAVRTGEPRALAESQKFPWSPQLYPSVCLTGGGCLAACREALRTRRAAAGLVSGFHHAHADHGEGFCTFNGLIVAIDALRAAGELGTAAILDMDLHYGNGTASLAASRPYVFALSIYGNDYANNVAYRDVTVRHHEDGPNHRSAPLPSGCGRATMLRTLEDHLPSLVNNPIGRPDLLIYQAGADPYFEDPYSPLKLDQADLLARDRRVFEFARDEKLPIAWVLAGGYTEDVTKVVQVHVNTFRAYRDVFE